MKRSVKAILAAVALLVSTPLAYLITMLGDWLTNDTIYNWSIQSRWDFSAIMYAVLVPVYLAGIIIGIYFLDSVLKSLGGFGKLAVLGAMCVGGVGLNYAARRIFSDLTWKTPAGYTIMLGIGYALVACAFAIVLSWLCRVWKNCYPKSYNIVKYITVVLAFISSTLWAASLVKSMFVWESKGEMSLPRCMPFIFCAASVCILVMAVARLKRKEKLTRVLKGAVCLALVFITVFYGVAFYDAYAVTHDVGMTLALPTGLMISGFNVPYAVPMYVDFDGTMLYVSCVCDCQVQGVPHHDEGDYVFDTDGSFRYWTDVRGHNVFIVKGEK